MRIKCPKCSTMATVTFTGPASHTLTVTGQTDIDCEFVRDSLASERLSAMECPHLDGAAAKAVQQFRRKRG